MAKKKKEAQAQVPAAAAAEAQPQSQAQTTDNSPKKSVSSAAEVSEEKEKEKAGEAGESEKAKVAREAAEAEAEATAARESEQAEREAEQAAAERAAAAEATAKEQAAREAEQAEKAAAAKTEAEKAAAAKKQTEQREKIATAEELQAKSKAEAREKAAAREATAKAKAEQAAREAAAAKKAVADITKSYEVARGRELFQCLQFLRSNRWPEEKENHGNMAKEADEKLIEMILHARANPNSRTAKVFREQYQFDVNTGTELEEKSSADQESDGKNKKTQLTEVEKNVQHTLKKAYKEAVRLETNLVAEFLRKHKEAIKEEIKQGSLITSSKFKNVDGNNIQLSQIIDHTRESRLIRWLLSWLPIPGCFYSGARSYGLFKRGFKIDTRDSTNRQKPSAKIAAEMLVERKARSAA